MAYMRKRIAFGIGILVALFIVAAFTLFAYLKFESITIYPEHFGTLWNAPQDVKDMTFVVKTNDGEGLSRIVLGGIQTFSFPERHFIELERSGASLYALIEQTGSGAIDVFRIEGKTMTPLTTDGMKKNEFSVSPDGKELAYVTETEDPLPPDVPYDVSRYTTHLVNIDTGEETKTFPSNHPYFLSDSLLFSMAPNGFNYHAVQGGTESYVFDPLAILVRDRPWYGANRAFVVQNPKTFELLIRELAATEQYPLARDVATIPGAAGDIVLTREKSVFRVTHTGDTLHIEKYGALDQPPEILLAVPTSIINPLIASF